MVPETSKMDHQVQGSRDLAADRRQREIRTAEYHGLQTGEHVPRAVGVAGGKRAVVSRIIILTTLRKGMLYTL